nr:transposase [Castellaniella sp.]
MDASCVSACRQARVLHGDETPMKMLNPGGRTTHKLYLWAYAPAAFEDFKAVV